MKAPEICDLYRFGLPTQTPGHREQLDTAISTVAPGRPGREELW